MKKFNITTEDKKSVTEVEIWCKDAMEIRREIGWRWGNGIITVNNKKEEEKLSQEAENGLVNAYDYEYEPEMLDDSCWEDVTYPDDMDEEEKERLEDLWEEENMEGWMDDGWSIDDGELWYEGDIKLTLVEEKEEKKPKKKAKKKAKKVTKKKKTKKND